MKWPHVLGWAFTAALVVGVLGGCALDKKEQPKTPQDHVQLTVFAAASMTETMNQIAETYKKEHPNVDITCNYDSSGTLKTQIQNGADCDVFISAAQKQMNQLDASQDEKANPEKLDFIDTSTRVNVLENKVVLVTPKGNPKHISSFNDMADKLKAGTIRLAMGNRDVPVGQYTQKILTFYHLDENAIASAGHITYGSNVKEVTTQVKEGSADCGIIYATDAYSAQLSPIDRATKEMCGQVVYPAAVLKTSTHLKEAKEFLQYLQGDEAMRIFTSVGFSPIQ